MKFAAKKGDRVVGKDIHFTKIPSGYSYIIVPMVYPYFGKIDQNTSSNVLINSKEAATVDSISVGDPNHTPYGLGFAGSPDNRGVVVEGSSTVLINGKRAARNLDAVSTCDDIVPRPVNRNSKIVCNSSVIIGG